MAWRLAREGVRVALVDDARPGRASPVAAGLLNPITGQRLVLAEGVELLLPRARAFYLELEAATGGRWFYPLPIWRDFRTEEESEVGRRRREDPHFALYLEEEFSSATADCPFGRLCIGGGGWLDYRRLPELPALAGVESRSASIRPEDLLLHGNGVRWNDRTWDILVLTTGFTPEWNGLTGLRWQAAAGDLLTVAIPDWEERAIRTRGLFTVPLGDGLFRCGATYEREDLSAEPRPIRREALALELHSWTRRPLRVLDHQVGIRPILAGRQPVAASLPDHPGVFLLNGLGSKGALLAPYLSEILTAQILEGRLPEARFALPALSGKTIKSPRLTMLAHEAILNFCQPGDWAVDGTAGLGRDTVCLARAVGPTGKVAALEIQAHALAQTHQLLERENLLTRTELHAISHDEIRRALPSVWAGKINAVVLNLGYLPGGDPVRRTAAASTLCFLDRILPWMATRALFSILTYRGHPGGLDEFDAVSKWVSARRLEKWTLVSHSGPSPTSPVLFLLKRQATDL